MNVRLNYNGKKIYRHEKSLFSSMIDKSEIECLVCMVGRSIYYENDYFKVIHKDGIKINCPYVAKTPKIEPTTKYDKYNVVVSNGIVNKKINIGFKDSFSVYQIKYNEQIRSFVGRLVGSIPSEINKYISKSDIAIPALINRVSEEELNIAASEYGQSTL